MAEKGARSYVVEQPGRPQEAEAGGRIADDGEAGVDGRRRGDSRGAGILAGLSRGRCAGMMGFGGERMEQLRVAST